MGRKARRHGGRHATMRWFHASPARVDARDNSASNPLSFDILCAPNVISWFGNWYGLWSIHVRHALPNSFLHYAQIFFQLCNNKDDVRTSPWLFEWDFFKTTLTLFQFVIHLCLSALTMFPIFKKTSAYYYVATVTLSAGYKEHK